MWLLYGSDVSGKRSRSVNNPQPRLDVGEVVFFCFAFFFFKAENVDLVLYVDQDHYKHDRADSIQENKTHVHRHEFAEQQVWQLYKLPRDCFGFEKAKINLRRK